MHFLRTTNRWAAGTLLALVVTSQAYAVEFDGIYQGAMQIHDAERGDHTVPLQISLVFTNETVTRPSGEIVQLIDGSFLVDSEGGPYAFTRVNLDLMNSRIDLRYTKPGSEVGMESPASLRLMGTYDEINGTIKGQVTSGPRGPMGTFELKWQEGLRHLKRQRHFHGRWQGQAQLAKGGSVPMVIRLSDIDGAMPNPSNFEFEYTPAKVASFVWNRLRLPVDRIHIDYLTGIVGMQINPTGTSAGLSVEFKMVKRGEQTVAIGKIFSSTQGLVAHFKLDSF